MSLLPVREDSFFSSRERNDGMRLRMRYRSGLVYTDMTVGNAFQGYNGVVHGGMLFGILDVIMWYATFLGTKKIYMTRKTDMDFLKPVMCGQPYRAQGRLLPMEGRDLWATAWIEDARKERCAEAKALFREARGLDHTDLMGKLDFTGVSPGIREAFMSDTPWPMGQDEGR
jgi:acyl-coenzyme A thioesterase PaaI-like protein